ncbi:kinase-like domain-containing protein [Mycena filopes]|nr:kinase-like domain-containing protein [Mycena filopes]
MLTSEFTLASSDHSLFSGPMDNRHIENLTQALSTSLAIDRVPSLLIYQNVFALVYASYAAKSQTDSDMYNLNTLDVQRVNMSGDDSISAIIKSLNSRKVLLQFAAAIGIHGDAGLREALRQDEERLAEHIVRILNSDSDAAAVQNLEGDSAQIFLDVLQNTLDRGLLLGKEHNSKARRMILKLSEACDRLPSALFITGVTGRDEFALFGGGFGDIYQASYAGQTVALKLLRHFPRDAEQRRIRLQFCREALVWQRLRHPHILPLLGIDRDTFPSSLCMVSPWMQNGTVLKYLNDHGRANVDKLLWEVAQGLHYLHSQNLVHGDLRGSNILITPEWRACLTDFGLASISDATTKGTTKQSGSIRWMAPELIDPSQFGGRFLRTFASDVYAFGCVCIEVRATAQPAVLGLPLN